MAFAGNVNVAMLLLTSVEVYVPGVISVVTVETIFGTVTVVKTLMKVVPILAVLTGEPEIVETPNVEFALSMVTLTVTITVVENVLVALTVVVEVLVVVLVFSDKVYVVAPATNSPLLQVAL